MSEPQFLPSGVPHSVEMPEGSSVAKSRSATVGVDIRRTEQDRFASDQDIAVESHHIVLQASATEARGAQQVFRNDQIERASKARAAGFVSTAPGRQTAATDARAASRKPVYDQDMAEMNFPARLIQLKIDNDAVREQLHLLDALLHADA